MISANAFARSDMDMSEEQLAFFDDMHRMFLGLGRGEVGKYMYDNPKMEKNNVWEQIVNTKSDYYVPQAEVALFEKARKELPHLVPQGTAYVDFGVGGEPSFKRYVLPTLECMGSKEYFGLDYDIKILRKLKAMSPGFLGLSLHAIQTDFFLPTTLAISSQPALGVMNGITLGNMYGALYEQQIGDNVVRALKHLHRLTNNGWLLVTIDTNQNEAALLKMYLTPLNSQLNVSSLPRMEQQLPVKDFDASLFDYSPEWFPDRYLLAHLVTATENQDFLFGDYRLSVEKGQKVHLFNSYKFPKSFFETYCAKAGLSVIRSWDHETGIVLYLLKASDHHTNGLMN